MGQHGRAHTPYDSDAGYQCGCELPYRGGWPRRTTATAQLIKLPLLLRINSVPVILISFRNRFLALGPDYNLRMSWQLSRVDALKTETHLSVSSRRQDWLRD